LGWLRRKGNMYAYLSNRRACKISISQVDDKELFTGWLDGEMVVEPQADLTDVKRRLEKFIEAS